MIRGLRLFLCVVALTGLLSGCGSGGNGTSDSEGKPAFRPRPGEASKKEFMMELLKKQGKLPATQQIPKK
jgi:hypothetical protein